MKKTLSVLLTIAMLLSLSVCAFAEGETVIKAEPVTTVEGTDGAATTEGGLQEAVDKADGGTVVVEAPADDPTADFGGVVVDGDDKNLTIQVEGEVVISDPSVGSAGTTTIGLQLIKESEKVTIEGKGEGAEITFDGLTKETDKDGVDGNDTMKRGIQNYTDLTLDNVTIDGTDLSNYQNINGTQTFDPDYENIVISNCNGSMTVTGGADILAAEGDAAFAVYAYTNNGYTDGPTVVIESDAGTIQGTIQFTGDAGCEEKLETKPSLSIEGGNFVNFLLQIGEAVADFAKDHIKISGGTFDSKDVETAGDTADNAKYAFEDFLVESYVVVEQGGKYVVMTQEAADALNKEVVAVIPFTPAEYNYYTGGTTGTVATAGNAEVVVDGETVSVALNDTVVSAKVAPVALADNAPAEVKVVVSHTALSGNVFTAIDMVQNIADTLIVKDVEGVHLDAEHYEVIFDGYDTITLKLAPELLAELGAGSHVFTIVLGGGYEIQVTVVVA